MDRSTPQRIAPSRLDVYTVLHNAGNGRITIREFEHFGTIRTIGLGITIDEGNAF